MTDISANETVSRRPLEGPALPDGSTLIAIFGKLATFSGMPQLWQAIQRRRQFRALLEQDDRMLADMGLTRHGIESHLTLPLYVNAAVEIRRNTARSRG